MLEGIIALLKVLPKLWALAERLGLYIKEKNLDAWLSELHSTIDLMESAKTPEDKRAASRNLVKLVRGL